MNLRGPDRRPVCAAVIRGSALATLVVVLAVVAPAVFVSAYPRFATPDRDTSGRHANDALTDCVRAVGARDQQSVWSVRYTLRLSTGSGGEQSIDVVAPPGGVQLALRDMTGDKVVNDLVVTPVLLHWPLTVLVNDGHNH